MKKYLPSPLFLLLLFLPLFHVTKIQLLLLYNFPFLTSKHNSSSKPLLFKTQNPSNPPNPFTKPQNFKLGSHVKF